MSAAQQAVELRLAKQDADAAKDQWMLAKRETERMKKLVDDVKEDCRRQLGELSHQKATVDSQLSQLRAEVEKERHQRREAELELRNALEENRRIVQRTEDTKDKVNRNLTMLYDKNVEYERELRRAQHSLRDAEKDKQRADLAEGMLAKREEHINALVEQLSSMRDEFYQYRLDSQAKLMSVQRSSVSAQRENSTAPPAGPPPPPPAPENDPHVQQSARIVAMCKEWFRKTQRHINKLEEFAEALYEDVRDSNAVLERGAASAQLDMAHKDRRVAAKMREMEQLHAEQSRRSIEDSLPSVTVVGNYMSDLEFGVNKIQEVLSLASDAVKTERKVIDRYCSAGGIGTLSDKRTRQQRQQDEQPDGLVQDPQSPLVLQHTGTFAPQANTNNAAAAQMAVLEERLKDKEKEILSLRSQIDALEARMSEVTASNAKLTQRVQKAEEEAQEAMLSSSKSSHQQQRQWLEEKNSLLSQISEVGLQVDAARREAEESYRKASHDHAHELRQIKDDHRLELRAKDDRINELESIGDQLKERLAKATARVDALTAKKEQLKDEIVQLQQSLVQKSDECNRHVKDLDVLSEALQSETRRRESAETEIEELQRAQMEAAISPVRMEQEAAVYSEWKQQAIARQKEDVARTNVRASPAAAFVQRQPTVRSNSSASRGGPPSSTRRGGALGGSVSRF